MGALRKLGLIGILTFALLTASNYAQIPVGTPISQVAAQWVVDEGSQVFNVKAYGAKGDGSTDDTTAIVATKNAAATAGGIIYFPPGTFKVTSGLTFPSNTHIIGAGVGISTLVFAGQGSNVNAITLPFGDGFLMSDLTVQQSGHGQDLIELQGGSQPTFRNLRLLSAGRDAFHAEPSSNWSWIEKAFLENVRVQSAGRDGFNFTLNSSAQYVFINVTTLLNCEVRGAGGSTTGYPIHFYSTNTTAEGMGQFLMYNGELDMQKSGSNDPIVKFEVPSGNGGYANVTFEGTAMENTSSPGASEPNIAVAQTNILAGLVLINPSIATPLTLGCANFTNSQYILIGTSGTNWCGSITFPSSSGRAISLSTSQSTAAPIYLTDNYAAQIGLQLQQVNIASSGSNYYGPFEAWESSYWNGTAPANDFWTCGAGLGTGANPESSWGCSHSGSPGFAYGTFPNLVAATLSNAIATTTSTDQRGTIILSSGTGTYTFTQGPGLSGIWTTAPICQVQDQTFANQASTTMSVTTSTLTIGNSVGRSDTYTYLCSLGN